VPEGDAETSQDLAGDLPHVPAVRRNPAVPVRVGLAASCHQLFHPPGLKERTFSLLPAGALDDRFRKDIQDDEPPRLEDQLFQFIVQEDPAAEGDHRVFQAAGLADRFGLQPPETELAPGLEDLRHGHAFPVFDESVHIQEGSTRKPGNLFSHGRFPGGHEAAQKEVSPFHGGTSPLHPRSL